MRFKPLGEEEASTRAVPPDDLQSVGALRAKQVRRSARKMISGLMAVKSTRRKHRSETCRTSRPQNRCYPRRRHRRANAQRHPGDRQGRDATGPRHRAQPGKGRTCRSRPLAACRRQVDTCCGVSPRARAIGETFAATIRSFAERRRGVAGLLKTRNLRLDHFKAAGARLVFRLQRNHPIQSPRGPNIAYPTPGLPILIGRRRRAGAAAA
jgi:hypothetical protein